MKIPVHRLKKDTLIWLNNHYCEKHRHTYLQHYQCYLDEKPETEKTAVLDIETSNLKADYGIVLTWCLKPLGKKTLFDVITPADIAKGRNGDEDRRVVRSCIDACLQYD